MSAAAGTESRDQSAKQVTEEADTDSTVEPSVSTETRLVEPTGEPYPYTKIRDWIPLVGQDRLSDGAFRLYYISRSLVWENTKGGIPMRPIIKVTYEEYAQILGRCAKTISRFAQDLYTLGLWEELDRSSRSIKIPGKRPQVRTVITVRVNDYPPEPWAWEGPVKTWDVLGPIRAAKEAALGAGGAPADGTAETDVSGQRDQRTEPRHPAEYSGTRGDAATRSDPAAARTARTPRSAQCDQGDSTNTTDEHTVATPAAGDDTGGTDRTAVSGQCHDADTITDPAAAAESSEQDPLRGVSPAQTPESAAECARKQLSEPGTNLSEPADVSAGQTPRNGNPKKTREQETPPSLPPAPSDADADAGHAAPSFADELAMFSPQAIELVTELYTTSLSLPSAQPLSSKDRASLAMRIDKRLQEGWSFTRVQTVLTNGTLVGMRLPGRLWASRLDDMPPYLAAPRDSAPARTAAPPGADTEPGRRPPARPLPRGGRGNSTNDSSRLPEPNAGKTRYEVPDGRGTRMAARWADADQTAPWCGRCAPDARTLRPAHPGAIPSPCPTCHPEPAAFAESDAIAG